MLISKVWVGSGSVPFFFLNGIFKIMKVICESPVVEKLITHVFPMSRIQEALELSASHECGKIMLKPWEE